MDALAARRRRGQSALGAIGYCLGGTAVLELAAERIRLSGRRELPRPPADHHACHATPSSRPSPSAPARTTRTSRSPTYGLPGRDDGSDADCQVIVYTGTKHSFTNPDPSREGPDVAFHARNAARSWDAMRAFLQERDVTPIST